MEDAWIYPRTSDTWRTVCTVRTPWRIPYIFIMPLCLRDDVVDARSFGSLDVLRLCRVHEQAFQTDADGPIENLAATLPLNTAASEGVLGGTHL